MKHSDTSAPLRFTPFAERRTEFLGVREAGGCRLKLYSIACGDRPFDLGSFEPALAQALAAVPPPDPAAAAGPGAAAAAYLGRTLIA